MNYGFWILIIIWAGIILVLVLNWLGFDFISVVSNSMKHENEESFFQFWQEKGCDIGCVKNLPLSNGFQGGDLLILKKTSDYKVGDVVPYKYSHQIIIHRLVNLNETQAFFQGDNIKNTGGNILLGKESVEKKFILGKIIFKIPKLGLVKALLNCWGKRCDYIDCIANGNCN